MNSTFKKSIVAGMMTLTMLGSSPAAHAQTPTVESLQAQIAQLIATIAQLQAGGGQSSSGQFGSYTWTRSLSLGSTGADVQKLQQFLNTDSDTRVALTGVGSAGSETQYYGPATAAAVSKFQLKYRGEILTPNGLTNPTGFFGPASIKKANGLVASTPTQPTNPTTPSPTPDTEETILRGEGALGTFEISSAANGRVQEAAADAVVAELVLEAHDGDIEINRMDFALVADSGNEERDPWDTFETISLWVDGKQIDEIRIDDRSDYLNRNQGTVRFTNLDLVLLEDEEVEIEVAVSIRNNIDGAGSNAQWSIRTDRIRYFDADKVATDDSKTGELGDGVEFEIVERGFGEELKFSIGENNPERKNIIVDESRRTTNVSIMEYTIEAIDADIELDTLYVNVITGTAAVADVINDIRLVVGNQTFKRDATLTSGDYSATSTRFAFDIDGDVTIDMDEKVTARVIVDLKPQTNYSNGETIRAQVTSTERDSTKAEGSDDIEELSGTAIGKQHLLVSSGLVADADSVQFRTETQGQNDTIGIFVIEFDVTAIENDFYIADSATSTATTTAGGVQYSITTNVDAPTVTSGILTSTARETDTGSFIVREGQTETFTLRVVVDAASAGQHRVSLDAIHYSTNEDGISNPETYQTLPINLFRSQYQFINN